MGVRLRSRSTAFTSQFTRCLPPNPLTMTGKHRPVTAVCAAACAATLVAGCASAAIQHAYVAPTEQTVYTAIEETPMSPGQIIYVENRSSVPVNVYSVTLRECENVKGGCTDPRSLNLHVQPAARATLVRVEPANAQNAFGFRYTFGRRADSSTTAMLGALANAGDSTAQQRLAAIGREDARRRGAVGAIDLDLTASEIAGLADRAGSLRVLPDSVVLPVGLRMSVDTVRVLLIGL